jgi:predicted transposase/invertase (TIGR01784 family)
MRKKNYEHDAFFKHCLTNPELALEYLQMHLPQELQNELDFSNLKIEQESFVDTSLKKQVSDILFSCNTKKGKRAQAYLLCESQSTQDYFMSFRLTSYAFAIADRHFKQNPRAKKFPMIYHITIYNGKRKHTAPRALHKLFEYPDIAKKVLCDDYHLIDLNKFSDEDLREKKFAGSMMFFMKHIFDADVKDLLKQKSDCLKEVALKTGGLDFLTSVLKKISSKLKRKK